MHKYHKFPMHMDNKWLIPIVQHIGNGKFLNISIPHFR